MDVSPGLTMIRLGLRVAWADASAWAGLLDGTAGPMCADAHLETNQFSRLIAELHHSYVRLAYNQYRRGYTVVILKRHANELFELSDAELAGYWRDVAGTAAALQRVFGAVKINYAILGDLCPLDVKTTPGRMSYTRFYT